MKINPVFKSATALAALLALGACDNMPTTASTVGSGSSYPSSTTTSSAYPVFGVVQSIELASPGVGGSGVGAGTIAGAVVGGIVGNQVGSGGGKTAATVLGAAGGAYAGHELEKRNQQTAQQAYKITVRLRDGSIQTVTQTDGANFRVGDPVKIENGVAQRY